MQHNELTPEEKIEEYARRTDTEQYQNNVEAWKTFLSKDPEKNPYCDDPVYQQKQVTMRKFFALLDYLGLGVEDISHGGRIQLESEDMKAILAELTDQKKAISSRPAASHKIVLDEGTNQYKELRLQGGVKAISDAHHYAKAFLHNEHWGMDVGVAADAGAHPANGSYGHVYLNIFHPDSDKKGALLLGVEGSAPGKSNQFNQLHNASAKANLLSATGATKKKEAPPKPFIRIDNVQEALAYVNDNYENIENKWKKDLADEQARLAAIAHDRDFIKKIENELNPALDQVKVHQAKANHILETADVSKNIDLLNLENLKSTNKSIITNLENYIEAVKRTNIIGHEEYLKQAKNHLESLKKIDHDLESKMPAEKEPEWLNIYFMDGLDFSDKIKSGHQNSFLLVREQSEASISNLKLYYIDDKNRVSELTHEKLELKSLFANFLQGINDKKIKINPGEIVCINDDLKEEEKKSFNINLKKNKKIPLSVKDQLAYAVTTFNRNKIKDYFVSTKETEINPIPIAKEKTEVNRIAEGPLNKSDETWAMEMLMEALLRKDPKDPVSFHFKGEKEGITAKYKGIQYDLNQILPFVNWSQIRRFSDDTEIQKKYMNLISTQMNFKPGKPTYDIPGKWKTADPTQLNDMKYMPSSDDELADQKLYIGLKPVETSPGMFALPYKIKIDNEIKEGHISINDLKSLMKNDKEALAHLENAMDPEHHDINYADWEKIKSFLFRLTPVMGYADHFIKNINDNDTSGELAHLNKAEKIALNIYSSNAGFEMNDLLRCDNRALEGKIKLKTDIKDMDAAITELLMHVAIATPGCYAKKGPLENDEGFKMVRRINVSGENEFLLKDILEKAYNYKYTGEEFVHRVPEGAFQSSSTNESAYSNILSTNPDNPAKPKYVVIVFSNNVPGIPMSALCLHPGENEFLMAPGTGGLVYEKIAQSDNSYVVVARVVNTPTDLQAPTPENKFRLNADCRKYKEKQLGISSESESHIFAMLKKERAKLSASTGKVARIASDPRKTMQAVANDLGKAASAVASDPRKVATAIVNDPKKVAKTVASNLGKMAITATTGHAVACTTVMLKGLNKATEQLFDSESRKQMKQESKGEENKETDKTNLNKSNK